VINIEQSILKALAYFNIFNYPLRRDEIFNFLDTACEKDRFDTTLNSLCDAGVVFRVDEFYSIQKNDFLAYRRKAGNKRAAEQLKIAGKVSRILYRFPFVKGVAVSGSLSKNYADKNSDIDFFIITKANRLWLARTFMHLFKKITFITGRQHWYCMNYYIDEMALEIKEKNAFTAVEIMTVLPLQGNGVFRDFFIANNWTKAFFPFYQPRMNAADMPRKGILKSLGEKIFDNKIGDWLNERLMKVTVRRWKKKAEQHQRSYSGELMGLDADTHYAKPDPANLQKKILYRYEKETEALMMRIENVHSA
jgi:predicted nucleotidyltransferase